MTIAHALRRILRPREHFEPVELAGLLGQCHSIWPTDPIFSQQWNDLAARSPTATTFHSPTWLRDGIGLTLPRNTLRLLTIHRANHLTAVLPLQLTHNRFLESAGYAVSDYLDPLIDPAHEQDSCRLLLRLIRQLWTSRVRGLTLHNISAPSPTHRLLPALALEAGFICEEYLTDHAAILKLPSTWDEYLSLLDPHERKELRRKIRKAETQAAARLLIIDHHNFTNEHISTALDLIEAADDSKRQWLRENVRPLMARIAPDLMRQHRMRLLMLMLNDTPAACLIDFPSPRGPMLYNSGFDPAHRHLSPGAVTFALAIHLAITEQAQQFDFLRGQESYKHRLGATNHPLYRLTLRR